MLQYLIHTFGYNQPFSISEIEYKDFSRTWKYNCIVELCQKGEVVHLERDVYYVPKKNKFGIVPFDPMRVIILENICYINLAYQKLNPRQ